MTKFNFSFDSGTSLQQMIGFEVAGQIWSSYLRDNTTLNVHVGVSSSLPTGVIGGALAGIHAKQHYAQVRNRLQADRLSNDDHTAFQNLQDEVDKYTAFIDGNKIDNNIYMNVTRANAKALGLLSTSNQSLDGYILMSSLANQNVAWDYNYARTTPAAANRFDFLSTAIHEIGHLLGFVSGIDKPGWLTQKTQYNASTIDDYYASLTGKVDSATVLDLYRRSAQSLAAGGVSEGWMDLSIGGNPYFSIDGGRTALAHFSTGEATNLSGDGYQASHWKNQVISGIMNPTLALGTYRQITSLDLRAMDVIGWDVVSTGINTSINLSNLQTQAKQKLATRLGQSVSWLDANSNQASQLLGQNRDQDISNMIDQSKVYEWGSDGDPFWQKIQTLFFQQGLFSRFAPELINSGHTSESDWTSHSEVVTMPSDLSIQFENISIATPVTFGRSEVIFPIRSVKLEVELESGLKVQPMEAQVMELRNDRFDLTKPKSFNGESFFQKVQPSSQYPDLSNTFCWLDSGSGDFSGA